MRRASLLRLILTLAACGAGWPQAAGSEPGKPALDPELPYQAEKLNPVTYDVDFRVVVTPPYQAQVLKVWLPLPPSDAAQQISRRRLDTFPMEVEPRIATEPVYGNRFACFEFREPKGAQIIRHRFRAKVWELRWRLEPGQVSEVEQWPEGFAAYLEPQPELAGDAAFHRVLGKAAPRRGQPFADLAGLMGWIDENLTYDHIHASLRADAEHAFTERRGHCSDYHGLCATMARSLGYPSRVTYGLAMFPKNSPSHCKLEAFLPPYGWVSFDLSETQKLVRRIHENDELTDAEKDALADKARARLRSGFRDNTWLKVTQGTDYELAPPASRKVPVVRTIYAEADGEPLPDPDPANLEAREFAWMTSHAYVPDQSVTYPFKDLASLEKEGNSARESE